MNAEAIWPAMLQSCHESVYASRDVGARIWRHDSADATHARATSYQPRKSDENPKKLAILRTKNRLFAGDLRFTEKKDYSRVKKTINTSRAPYRI
jgi:hypothetical protein